MTRQEAWLLVLAGAGLVICAQSLYHAFMDIVDSIEIITERAEAPTIPSPAVGSKIYHSAASTDARRPGKDASEGGRHAAD